MLEYSGQDRRGGGDGEIAGSRLRVAVVVLLDAGRRTGVVHDGRQSDAAARAFARDDRSRHRRALGRLRPHGGDGPRQVHQPVLAAGRQSRLQRVGRSHSARGSTRRAGICTAGRSRGVSDAGTGVGSLRRHAGDRRARRSRTRWCCRARRIGWRSASIRSRRRAGGVVAPLVDVGRGDRDEDYAGKDAEGRGRARRCRRRRAVAPRGRDAAARSASISTTLPAYLNADAPGAPGRRRAISGTSCSGAAFRTTRRARASGSRRHRARAATLRKRLAARRRRRAGDGARDDREHRSPPDPARTLVAEIPGAHRARRAHRPRGARAGAGRERQRQRRRDAGRAGASRWRRRSGRRRCRRPARTLTFLFLNEISGSRRWLQDHPDEAKQVKYMFSLDMTGEDVDEDRRQLSDRALSRSGRGVGSAVGSAQRVGQRQRPRRVAEGRSDQRRAPRRAARASRGKTKLGGEDESVRRRQRSHRVRQRRAFRRCSTGTSPIATTTRTSTRRTRPARRKCGTSASRSAPVPG